MPHSLTPDLSQIGPRLRQARQFLKLNQKEFSMLINVSQSNLSDYENKKVIPEERTLDDILRRAGINDVWFATGEGPILRSSTPTAENATRGNGRALGINIPEGYIQISTLIYDCFSKMLFTN